LNKTKYIKRKKKAKDTHRPRRQVPNDNNNNIHEDTLQLTDYFNHAIELPIDPRETTQTTARIQTPKNRYSQLPNKQAAREALASLSPTPFSLLFPFSLFFNDSIPNPAQCIVI
jgi:hypothetical protein